MTNLEVDLLDEVEMGTEVEALVVLEASDIGSVSVALEKVKDEEKHRYVFREDEQALYAKVDQFSYSISIYPLRNRNTLSTGF